MRFIEFCMAIGLSFGFGFSQPKAKTSVGGSPSTAGQPIGPWLWLLKAN